MQAVLRGLHRGPLLDRACLCGMLWELSADQKAAGVIAAAGPVPPLLAVLQAAVNALPKGARPPPLDYMVMALPKGSLWLMPAHSHLIAWSWPCPKVAWGPCPPTAA